MIRIFYIHLRLNYSRVTELKYRYRMNFLAHLYLSGDDDEIKIGNFIADSVKGNAHQNYKRGIQNGILLHRKIDQFTDNHLITKELSLLLKSHYKKYSGVVIDIFYDHFLAQNWNNFSIIELEVFIKKCHSLLLKNIVIFPPKIKGILPIMVAKNRLLSYSKIEGIENVLKVMAKYTSLPPASNFAIKILKTYYQTFNEKFLIFFDDMIEAVQIELELLNAPKST